MITSTPEFQRTIIQSHEVRTKAVVVHQDTAQATLDIVDGNVRIDSNNKHRRTADVHLSDPTGDLSPDQITDLLHPLSGNEIVLYRGAYVPELREEELIPLGVFPIKDCEITDSGANVNVALKLVDRSLRLSRARATEPMVVFPNLPIAEVIAFFAELKWPHVKLAPGFRSVRPWITTPPGIIDRTTDLWDLFQKWARDAGLFLSFDNQGQMTLVPLPAENPRYADVKWTFDEGDLSTMLSLRRDLTQDNTFNYVMAYGQPTDGQAPVFFGTAIVGDHPLSVTGPMGEVPFFYSSSFLTTVEQCEAVASGLLWKHAGHSEHVHFNALVNPCIEDGDVVRVTRDRIKVDAFYTLDNITIPLTALRAMECDTRERFISV